jgi:hypothetical protein
MSRMTYQLRTCKTAAKDITVLTAESAVGGPHCFYKVGVGSTGQEIYVISEALGFHERGILYRGLLGHDEYFKVP